MAEVAMRIYACSDLHLQSRDEPYLFTAAKESVFAKICQEIDSTPESRLVLDGDVFDLTGMMPPARGLDDFFGRALGRSPDEPSGPARTPAEAIASIARRFPAFMDGIRRLAARDRLTFIPGNHDAQISGEARRELQTQIGDARLDVRDAFEVDGILFATHGNEFDAANRTDHGWRNPGSVITAALYHAIIPALKSLGVPPRVAHAVPSVRPEENIVSGLGHYLSKQQTKDLLLAFVELLRVNGYFHGLQAAKVWLATHLLGSLVTPERVREALRDDRDLKGVARRWATDLLSRGSATRYVVLGHTHELDATERYVNLGTWIDHVTGLLPADLIAVDYTLPVLLVENGRPTLYDCKHLSEHGAVAQCPVLWAPMQ